jgi:phage shock protein E
MARPIIVDLRSREDYARGHAPNAINIPAEMEPMSTQGRARLWQDLTRAFAQVDRRTPVFFYCREGNRARTGAAMLRRMGFPYVRNLGGPPGAQHGALR